MGESRRRVDTINIECNGKSFIKTKLFQPTLLLYYIYDAEPLYLTCVEGFFVVAVKVVKGGIMKNTSVVITSYSLYTTCVEDFFVVAVKVVNREIIRKTSVTITFKFRLSYHLILVV